MRFLSSSRNTVLLQQVMLIIYALYNQLLCNTLDCTCESPKQDGTTIEETDQYIFGLWSTYVVLLQVSWCTQVIVISVPFSCFLGRLGGASQTSANCRLRRKMHWAFRQHRRSKRVEKHESGQDIFHSSPTTIPSDPKPNPTHSRLFIHSPICPSEENTFRLLVCRFII